MAARLKPSIHASFIQQAAEFRVSAPGCEGLKAEGLISTVVSALGQVFANSDYSLGEVALEAITASADSVRMGPELYTVIGKERKDGKVTPKDESVVKKLLGIAGAADVCGTGVSVVRFGLRIAGFVNHALIIAMTVVPSLTIISGAIGGAVAGIRIDRLRRWERSSEKRLQALHQVLRPEEEGQPSWKAILEKTADGERFLRNLVSPLDAEGHQMLKRFKGATSKRDAGVVGFLVKEIDAFCVLEKLARIDLSRAQKNLYSAQERLHAARASSDAQVLSDQVERHGDAARAALVKLAKLEEARVACVLMGLTHVKKACKRAKNHHILTLLIQAMLIVASILCMTSPTFMVGGIISCVLIGLYFICLLARALEDRRISLGQTLEQIRGLREGPLPTEESKSEDSVEELPVGGLSSAVPAREVSLNAERRSKPLKSRTAHSQKRLPSGAWLRHFRCAPKASYARSKPGSISSREALSTSK